MGRATPKQLLLVAGRPIIAHSIAAFEASPEIDEILVMMTPGYVDEVAAIVDVEGFSKVIAILEGGVLRNDSTRRALEALGTGECNVLFHDAVRPLVSQRIVRDCAAALSEYEAVNVAIASTDTIVVVDGDVVVETPDRGRLWRCQTPQGFRLSTIRRAYELAALDPHFAATDDCSVVMKYLPGTAVHVVEGSEDNLKVTTAIDILIAEALLQR